jgi:hypothetical protein
MKLLWTKNPESNRIAEVVLHGRSMTGWIVTMSDSVGRSVTVSNGGWTNDHSTSYSASPSSMIRYIWLYFQLSDQWVSYMQSMAVPYESLFPD